MTDVPLELERITDVVLAYRPKPKSKAEKRRVRRKKREAKRDSARSAVVTCAVSGGWPHPRYQTSDILTSC